MSATNYQRGYRFENAVVNWWRALGYYAVRTAGSHTAIDVIAWSQHEVWLLQLKAAKITGPELEAAKAALAEVPFPPIFVGGALPGIEGSSAVVQPHREVWVKSLVRGEDWVRHEVDATVPAFKEEANWT